MSKQRLNLHDNYLRGMRKRDETIRELRSVLSQIVNALPTNRDWLDPMLEQQARELSGWKIPKVDE